MSDITQLAEELGEAVKKREKAKAYIARWTEQLHDAEEDIVLLSERITNTRFEPRAEDPAYQVDWEAEREALELNGNLDLNLDPESDSEQETAP